MCHYTRSVRLKTLKYVIMHRVNMLKCVIILVVSGYN